MTISKKLLTVENYLTSDGKYPDRIKSGELSIEHRLNVGKLLEAVNHLLTELNFELPAVTSGFRTAKANIAAGGSRYSAHCLCLAVDFSDTRHELYNLCAANVPLLELYGLYLEDSLYTKNWCHLTIRRPSSGMRFFKP